MMRAPFQPFIVQIIYCSLMKSCESPLIHDTLSFCDDLWKILLICYFTYFLWIGEWMELAEKMTFANSNFLSSKYLKCCRESWESVEIGEINFAIMRRNGIQESEPCLSNFRGVVIHPPWQGLDFFKIESTSSIELVLTNIVLGEKVINFMTQSFDLTHKRILTILFTICRLKGIFLFPNFFLPREKDFSHSAQLTFIIFKLDAHQFSSNDQILIFILVIYLSRYLSTWCENPIIECII